MSKGWDSGMLKKLKALVGKGLSTAEMGKKLGMSKNAVVGKLNRLGWNAKASEGKNTSAPKAKKSVKAVKAPAKTTVKASAKKADTKKTATKVVAKKVVKKSTDKKVAVKKAVVSKTKKAIKVEKKVAKPVKVKAVAKPVKPAKVTKKAVKETKAPKVKEEKKVIKTASKKTKKDLALHELMIQHALQMASLKSDQCRWPIGDPDSDKFHFCGEKVFAGKPYCYEHCRMAYQFAPPKKK